MANEAIGEYYVALQTMAKKCSFEGKEMQGQLRDQLIAGTNSRNIKYELLKSAEQEIDKLVALAETIEIADAEADLLTTQKLKQNTNSEDTESTVYSIKARNKQGSRSRQPNSSGRKFQDNTSGTQPTEQKSTSADSSERCYCCGGRNHKRLECTLRFKFCSECGKQGHIYKMCKKSKNTRFNAHNFVEQNDPEEQSTDSSDDENEVSFGYITDKLYHSKEVNKNNSERSDSSDSEIEYIKPCVEEVKINKEIVNMEIDTGANVSAINDKYYKRKF